MNVSFVHLHFIFFVFIPLCLAITVRPFHKLKPRTQLTKPVRSISSVHPRIVTGAIKDNHPAATGHHGFGLGHHHGGLGLDHGHHGYGDSKYFMYAHNPAYDEYEFGYRRGNDYHFQERYERGGPYWNFKTKVKWGDKYGGYGEHYWDYNHQDKGYSGGHGHGHGGHGHGDDYGGHHYDQHGHGHGHGGYGHGHGHYSEPVASYEPKPKATSSKTVKNYGKLHHMAVPVYSSLVKRTGNDDGGEYLQADPRHSRDIEHESDIKEPDLLNEDDSRKISARISAILKPQDEPNLSIDPISGQVTDETTGKLYWLKPVDIDSIGDAQSNSTALS